jgi:hypothetical protein
VIDLSCEGLRIFRSGGRNRISLLDNISEERKEGYLAEYQALAKNFPSSGTEVYGEAAQWSKDFLGASPESTNMILQGYKSTVASFRKGAFLTYREAANLCEKFNQSSTQHERWRVLKGLEILSERFAEGHAEVYETARFVRALFRHPSAHTQRQAFETYGPSCPILTRETSRSP